MDTSKDKSEETGDGQMPRISLTLHPAWRSEWRTLLLTAIFGVCAAYFSQKYPETIVGRHIDLFGLREFSLELSVLWIVPFWTFCIAMLRIYNVRYRFDNSGIEATEGILSLRQRTTRVSFVDIRSIEIEQSLFARILNVGNIEIETAASADPEITMAGIALPIVVRQLIEESRIANQQKGA